MNRDNVRMIRLSDGTNVIGEIQYSGGQDDVKKPETIKSPFEFIFSPAGAGLIPFMAMAKGHVVPYPKQEHIVCECLVADNLLDEYENAVSPSKVKKVERPGLLVP